ncbi:unnamed protein product, partial [Chrysoparadoxa australica]
MRKRVAEMTPARERCLSISTSNILENFPVLEELLEDHRLILLLDYDGTLTPIVSDPAQALLNEEVRATLRELPKHYITGVVSGRSLAKIRRFVDVDGLFYAGSHGFDIFTPLQPWYEVGAGRGGQDILEEQTDEGGPGRRYKVANEFLPVLQQMRAEVEEAIANIAGAEVEDNVYSVSVHYRNCRREDVPKVTAAVEGAQKKQEGIRIRTGKEVYELQPCIKWDKGAAVVWLLDMLGLTEEAGSDNVFTVFIGDDKTDEDAFKVFNGLHDKGKQPGLGILVSEESRETNAAFTLRNPLQVAMFLSRLVEIGRERSLEP